MDGIGLDETRGPAKRVVTCSLMKAVASAFIEFAQLDSSINEVVEGTGPTIRSKTLILPRDLRCLHIAVHLRVALVYPHLTNVLNTDTCLVLEAHIRSFFCPAPCRRAQRRTEETVEGQPGTQRKQMTRCIFRLNGKTSKNSENQLMVPRIPALFSIPTSKRSSSLIVVTVIQGHHG